MGQPGFFDLDERYRMLAESGDPLIKLAELIEFEVFRGPLVGALARSDGSKGGRPPYDPVLMFKILVLQTLYTLSDDAAECQRPPNFPRLWPSKIPWLDGFGRRAVISRRDDRSSPFLAAGHDV